jgi:hypothetical protein
MIHAIRVVVEELGIGALVGVSLTWLTTLMLRFAERQGWISVSIRRGPRIVIKRLRLDPGLASNARGEAR